ncbi:MAG: M24 family metallopeptidase, partial [Gemmatimonadetes bacterium]|nr:M24 family metallopeptidase [Gemmatimonadota bacterium]NIR37474.1 M24 family metallopeptidase [Actinomycetota bacterium]NIU67061.1 M24 family metallopeptidase [Actinomycetota bacterium]NIW28856.1 M24 family metallopeptidase [Actinomycetota bacterium]NIX21326.1 M24 family metallopeptidase [Actinomycetota bacterium]
MYLKTAGEIDKIARGGAIIGMLFAELGPRVRPGVTTLDLDRFCDDFIVSHDGAEPAFKGLYGFPGAVCVSVNEEIVHGIPSARRVLREGDIV